MKKKKKSCRVWDKKKVSFQILFRSLFAVLFLCLFLMVPNPGYTGEVTLTWDANTETDLAGYKVFSGTASGTYDTNNPIDVGNWTSCTMAWSSPRNSRWGCRVASIPVLNRQSKMWG